MTTPQNVTANKLARDQGGVVDIVAGRVEAVTDIGLDKVRTRPAQRQRQAS